MDKKAVRQEMKRAERKGTKMLYTRDKEAVRQGMNIEHA
jgi:hypothetical protein